MGKSVSFPPGLGGAADPTLTSRMHWIVPGAGDDPISVYCTMTKSTEFIRLSNRNGTNSN